MAWCSHYSITQSDVIRDFSCYKLIVPALRAKMMHLAAIVMTSNRNNGNHEILSRSVLTSTYIELHHTKSRLCNPLHFVASISKSHYTAN